VLSPAWTSYWYHRQRAAQIVELRHLAAGAIQRINAEYFGREGQARWLHPRHLPITEHQRIRLTSARLCSPLPRLSRTSNTSMNLNCRMLSSTHLKVSPPWSARRRCACVTSGDSVRASDAFRLHAGRTSPCGADRGAPRERRTYSIVTAPGWGGSAGLPYNWAAGFANRRRNSHPGDHSFGTPMGRSRLRSALDREQAYGGPRGGSGSPRSVSLPRIILAREPAAASSLIYATADFADDVSRRDRSRSK